MEEARRVTTDQLMKILNNSVFKDEPLKGELKPEMRLREDLHMDSLDKYEAVFAIEEALGISIPEGNMQGYETISQCLDYLNSPKR